jgi:hypothetical protein|nr:MAG TPA: hypothetical protein [Caudoviricetes sp.]
MDKDYIEVKIPILDSVDEMKVVKTFNQEQLWFVCAIAKAFEKSEQQVKKQKEVIDKAIEIINRMDKECEEEGCSFVNLIEVIKIKDILKEVSE